MISGIKILAIEDDPGDVELLRRYLRDVPDLKLEFADRLSTGLTLISENRVDLVLLDLGLQDSQGIETLTRLRSQVPDIPLVVLTGLTEEALGIAAIRVGAQDYLVKGQTNRANLIRSIHYAIERHATQKALRTSQALLKEAQRVAHIGHWEIDSATGTTTWSEEIFHIFGLDPARGEPSFAAHQDLIHPDDWDLLNDSVTRGTNQGIPFDIDFRLIRPDKSIRWMNASGYPSGKRDGEFFRMFGTAQDITERKQTEQKREKLIADLTLARETLQFQASRDALTSLWNRSGVLDRLNEELDRAAREAQPLTLIMADLDYLKRINDTYGHQVGDVVLQEVAIRTRASLRPYDMVGRYGGDEMLIILPGCDEEGAINSAERVRLSISDRAVETDEGSVPVTLSMGVASIDGLTKVDLNSLISAADKALYEAKDAGRNCVMIAGPPANQDKNLPSLLSEGVDQT